MSPPVEQRFAVDPSECVGEAVADVEPRRMTAPPPDVPVGRTRLDHLFTGRA